MTLFLSNLAVYSVQLAALTMVAIAAASLLRIRVPLFASRFWQAVMLVALLLPIVQPRMSDTAPAMFTAGSPTLFSARAPLAATATFDVATILAFILIAGITLRLAWLVLGLLRG